MSPPSAIFTASYYRKMTTIVVSTVKQLLEKCKTLRGEPELIMSCTQDSLKIGGGGGGGGGG